MWSFDVELDAGRGLGTSASKVGIGITTAMLLWTSMLAFTLRFFVVSFVTSCWSAHPYLP